MSRPRPWLMLDVDQVLLVQHLILYLAQIIYLEELVIWYLENWRPWCWHLPLEAFCYYDTPVVAFVWIIIWPSFYFRQALCGNASYGTLRFGYWALLLCCRSWDGSSRYFFTRFKRKSIHIVVKDLGSLYLFVFDDTSVSHLNAVVWTWCNFISRHPISHPITINLGKGNEPIHWTAIHFLVRPLNLLLTV